MNRQEEVLRQLLVHMFQAKLTDEEILAQLAALENLSKGEGDKAIAAHNLLVYIENRASTPQAIITLIRKECARRVVRSGEYALRLAYAATPRKGSA